jgi:multiple sugar transport system substrate-binding protein
VIRFRPARTRALVAALACLAIVCGCTRGGDDATGEIRFVTWKADQPWVWDEAIRRFETATGIHVRRDVGPHSSTALHDLLTQKLKNAGGEVDVFFMDVIWVAEFAAAGWALPLDDRFTEQERRSFLPGAIAANTWKGSVYGVPAFIDAGMLYYRRDLLEKHGVPVPRTWTDLEHVAKYVIEKEAGATPGLVGYSAQFKQYEGLVCNALEFVLANGGQLVDETASRSALREFPAIEAVYWLRDQVIGGIAPRSVLTYQEPESLALFLQGLAVFHRNWPFAWNVANDPEHSRVAGRVGVAPLPGFPGGGRSAAALGGWQYGVSALSLAPSRAAVYDDPEVRRKSPALAEQAEAFRQAVPRPVTPVYPAISHSLQRFFSAAIVDRDSDIEALAETASHEIDGLLALVP